MRKLDPKYPPIPGLHQHLAVAYRSTRDYDEGPQTVLGRRDRVWRTKGSEFRRKTRWPVR